MIPKVAVVFTSYNHARFLREALESVLNQTYADFDLIIYDDGSIDESWQIIQSYHDARIRTFRNETTKHNWGFRRAIREVQGNEYFAIQHSDDIWEANKLEKQVAFLDENPQVAAVFSRAQIIAENGEPFGNKDHPYSRIFDQPNRTRHQWLNHFFYYGNALCHPSVLIRKKYFDECGGYRLGFTQIGDFDTWERLCLKFEIHVIQEGLVRFRVLDNEMNSSGNRPEVRIRGQYELSQTLNNFRQLSTFEELVNVFPQVERYYRPTGCVPAFVLAMVTLEEGTSYIHKFFGLNLLFETLNDPIRVQQLAELYDFTHSDFAKLSASQDLFNTELVSMQASRLNALQQELNQAQQAIAEITFSRAWKIAQVLSRVRMALHLPGQKRIPPRN